MTRTRRINRRTSRKINNKIKVLKQQYTQQALKNAVDAVVEKRMTYRIAAEVFEVPRSTISDSVKGKVNALKKLADWGFGFTDKDLLSVIKTDFDKSGQNKFKNNMPGYKFLQCFKKRWKNQLSSRIAQNLPSNRASALASATLDSFFDMCKKYYDHLEVQPQNINNVDESGFSRTRLEENSL